MRFIAEISLWWLIPIIGLALLLTYFFYKDQSWLKEVSSPIRKTIYTLRFLALFFIGMLLIGIFFESVKDRIEKPVFITLMDNSSSLKNYKDSSKVAQQINDFQQTLRTKYKDRFEWKNYLVGSNFRSGDTLTFTDSKSNLSEGFESIYTNYYNRNIGGIIFISDGNFNEGQQPIYAAEKIALTPIFTLGVGDTVQKKDQLIRDAFSNEIAFLKNKFPIEVSLEAIKMGKTSSTVSILHKGKIIGSQIVNYTNGQYDYKNLSFEVEANELGFQHYQIQVAPIKGEYSEKNNTRSIYIEVVDGRNKILILAGAPHPDAAALKYVLQKDENVSVESHLITDWDKKLDKVDLIIWHEPSIQTSAPIVDYIQQSGKPIWYFIGPSSANPTTLNRLNLGINVRTGNQFDEVQPSISKGFEAFELSDPLKEALRFYPPVKVRYGEIKITPQHKVLLQQRVGDITKNDPLLFFGEKQGKKYGVFYGEGIWKWRLNEFLRTNSTQHFEELIQKVNQYLVVKENASALRITLPKRFTTAEEIRLKAEFYNDAMELITKPTIKFELKNEQGKKSVFDFGAIGNFYQLSIGSLNAGKYTWTASTQYNGKKHSKSGVFIVENIQLEDIETNANHSILQQISTNSNGVFSPLSEYQQLINAIDQRDDLVDLHYQESTFKNILDYWWILLVIIGLLGAEWILRRWNGSY